MVEKFQIFRREFCALWRPRGRSGIIFSLSFFFSYCKCIFSSDSSPLWIYKAFGTLRFLSLFQDFHHWVSEGLRIPRNSGKLVDLCFSTMEVTCLRLYKQFRKAFQILKRWLPLFWYQTNKFQLVLPSIQNAGGWHKEDDIKRIKDPGFSAVFSTPGTEFAAEASCWKQQQGGSVLFIRSDYLVLWR